MFKVWKCHYFDVTALSAYKIVRQRRLGCVSKDKDIIAINVVWNLCTCFSP